MGISVHAYLDNWLILAQSKGLCLSHPQQVLSLAQSLGFHTNLHISDIISSQQFSFLYMYVSGYCVGDSAPCGPQDSQVPRPGRSNSALAHG